MKAIVLLLAVWAGNMQADSIWPGGQASQGNNASLTADQKALSVGDLVMVRVSENAEAQQVAKTDTQKEANVSGGAGLGSWGANTLPLQSYGAGAQENASGGGTSTRSGKLVAALSARVVNVLPTGNLYIEARRTIQVNDEKQNIVLSGIIRPRDVGPDNSISSAAISDAQIRYEGKGPLSEKSHLGVFSRILDWLGLL
jgi:flagellar L-ring protein precursor FlgH